MLNVLQKIKKSSEGKIFISRVPSIMSMWSRKFRNLISKIKSIILGREPDKKLYGEIVFKFHDSHFYIAYSILSNLDGVYLAMCDTSRKIITIEYDRSIITCCSQIHNVLRSKNIKYEVAKNKNYKHHCDNHIKCE
ncbi:MAG: hypothetical protein QXF12_04685 [Candidatus Aenigmatarchaeota archaeon]